MVVPRLNIDCYDLAMSQQDPLKGGHPYKMVIMSVDFVGSTNLKVRIGESKAERLLNDWQQHMLGICKLYHGDRIGWGGDGGVLAFAGDDRIENALHAGLHGLHYPLARYVRPLMHGEAAHIRVALHHGVVTWQDDPGTINSKEIDLVCKLEKENCQQDALLVSEAYHRECGETLQKLFRPTGVARGGALFHTSLAMAAEAAGSPFPQLMAPQRKSDVYGTGRPHPHVKADIVNMSTSGVVRDSSYILTFELENQLPEDLAWARLQANYFDDEEQMMGSRIFDLGQKDSVKVLLHSGQKAQWTFIKQLKVKPAPGVHAWNHGDSEVYGKAAKAVLFVLDIQPTRKR